MDSRDGHWLGALWKDATAKAPFELISALKRDEAERRLKDAIDTEWTVFGSKPVIGYVDNHSFRLRRRIAYRNSFQTIVTGTLEDDRGKTRLLCHTGGQSFVIVFVAAFLIALGTGAATLSIVLSQHADAVAAYLPLIVAIAVAAPIGMLAFGSGLLWLGRRLARGERELLVAFLERTLEAKATV